MSTIASLIGLIDPSAIKPWSEGMQSVNREQIGRQQAQTGLIELARLKQSQASEDEVMRAIQQNPALAQQLLGGSVLGSIGPAGGTGAPGGPQPGAITQSPLGGGPAQQIAAYPDASRYAGVSPQGGGPIPPGMGQQMMPQVTPPQSTLASLGPAGQPQMQQPQNPLLEMARTNPRAALLLQNQLQGQEELQMKRYGDRLTMGTKIAEAVGREAQTATDQSSWDQARANVAQFDPKAAAAMQAIYSPEAKAAFVKRAVSVKDNAQLQLDTWQRQIEEGKLQVQLAQAGYQGLGEGVTGILRGLTPEQVKEFGGRTSDKAIAYATEEEKKRKLAQASEAERVKFDLEQKQKETLPLQDARKEDQDRFVYKATGDTVPGTLPYGEVKTLQGEKDPNKGVVHLTTDTQKQLTNLKQLEPVLAQYRELIQYAYGPGGPMANYTRSPGATISAAWNQATQADPKLEALRRSLTGQLQSLVRGLGAKGDLNEKELEAATQMIANFDASGSLGLSLGPMLGTGGIGVGASIKPSFSIPDTPAVGIELANQLIGTVNKRVGTILQNEGYSKTPTIVLPPAPPGQPTTGTATPPTTAATPPAATPPAKPKGRQPGEIPVLGGPGMPEQYLPAPGKQSQAQPGRRGIELARASGAKVMDMVDVEQAMEETGKSRHEVLAAARAKGYTVYGAAASSALA